MNKCIRPIKFIIFPLISAKIVMCDNYVKLKKSSNNDFILHYRFCYDYHNIKIKYGLNKDIKKKYLYTSEPFIFQKLYHYDGDPDYYERYNDYNCIGKISLPEDNSFFSKECLKKFNYEAYNMNYYLANAINLKDI